MRTRLKSSFMTKKFTNLTVIVQVVVNCEKVWGG